MAPPTFTVTYERATPSSPLPLQVNFSASSPLVGQAFSGMNQRWTLTLPPAPAVSLVPFPSFPQGEPVTHSEGARNLRDSSIAAIPSSTPRDEATAAVSSSAPVDEAALARSVQNIQASLLPPTPTDRLLSDSTLAGEVLRDLPLVGVVASAASYGRALADRVQQVERNIQEGKDPAEEIVCTGGGAVVETALSTLGTTALVAPLPLYLAEVAATPPLAVTLPAVAVALPEAHANMERVATALGEGATSMCHDLFAEARRISSRRNR